MCRTPVNTKVRTCQLTGEEHILWNTQRTLREKAQFTWLGFPLGITVLCRRWVRN